MSNVIENLITRLLISALLVCGGTCALVGAAHAAGPSGAPVGAGLEALLLAEAHSMQDWIVDQRRCGRAPHLPPCSLAGR